MKKSRIFWGTFLISLGVFFILDQFNLLNDLDFILKLWPLIFVFWGVSLLKIPDIAKKTLVGLTAFLLALFLIGIVNHNWCRTIRNQDWEIIFDDDDNNCYDSTYGSAGIQSSEGWDYDSSYKNITLNLDAGVGKFLIKNETKSLIQAHSYYKYNKYFDLDFDKKNQTIKLDIKHKKIKLKNGKYYGKIDIMLNPNPVWNLNMDVGASSLDCDLKPFKTRLIDIDAGAADIELKIGDLTDTTDISIDVGASNIVLEVPESSGCEIVTETFLVSKDFKGFKKYNDAYRTENFSKSKKKVFIRLEGGLAHFEVRRH